MSVLFYLLQGATLGLSGAAMPGPFQAYLLDQTLRRGARATLPFSLAPLVAEIPIVTLILLVVSQLPPWTISALNVAGGVLLLFLATESLRSLRASRRGPTATTTAAPETDLRAAAETAPGAPASPAETKQPSTASASTLPSRRAGFARAVAMNFLSPGPYMFWSLMAGPVVIEAAARSAGAAAGFAMGYYVLLIGGFAAFVVLFGLATKLGERAVGWIRLVTAVGLLGFGVYQIAKGAGGLL